MRIAVVAVCACLIAATTAPSPSPESRALRKDRAAMMIYQDRDRVVALLPALDANVTEIILGMAESESDTVALSQLENRPCIGIALFSNKDWTALTAGGRNPSAVRPSEATRRLRVYPATGNARVTVEDIEKRTAHVTLGLEFVRNPLLAARTRADSAKPWTPHKSLVQVLAQLDSARGRCSVE